MTSWTGEFVGGFVAVIFLPLFLFYLADRKGRRPRTAAMLRFAAVLVAVLATCAIAVGGGGRFPPGAVVAVFVCFVWAVRSNMRQRGSHLNGWQRLGVIASVLWLVGGFFGGVAIYVGDQTAPVLAEYQLCEAVADQKQQNYYRQQAIAQESHAPFRAADTLDADYAKCLRDEGEQWNAAITGRWWVALGFAVVPLLLVWGFAWLCVRLYRWVRAGFVRQHA